MRAWMGLEPKKHPSLDKETSVETLGLLNSSMTSDKSHGFVSISFASKMTWCVGLSRSTILCFQAKQENVLTVKWIKFYNISALFDVGMSPHKNETEPWLWVRDWSHCFTGLVLIVSSDSTNACWGCVLCEACSASSPVRCGGSNWPGGLCPKFNCSTSSN